MPEWMLERRVRHRLLKLSAQNAIRLNLNPEKHQDETMPPNYGKQGHKKLRLTEHFSQRRLNRKNEIGFNFLWQIFSECNEYGYKHFTHLQQFGYLKQ